MSELKPLLVSVREARRLLGDISNNRIWALIRTGELQIVGSRRKRWVVLASINAHVEQMVASALADHSTQAKRSERAFPSKGSK